jgi:hypothetical protein
LLTLKPTLKDLAKRGSFSSRFSFPCIGGSLPAGNGVLYERFHRRRNTCVTIQFLFFSKIAVKDTPGSPDRILPFEGSWHSLGPQPSAFQLNEKFIPLQNTKPANR